MQCNFTEIILEKQNNNPKTNLHAKNPTKFCMMISLQNSSFLQTPITYISIPINHSLYFLSKSTVPS